MTRYQVHFEYTHKGTRRLKHGIRLVNARNEVEAKARIRYAVPGSFGHWVNVHASEIAV
jgi:hypothetical protein